MIVEGQSKYEDCMIDQNCNNKKDTSKYEEILDQSDNRKVEENVITLRNNSKEEIIFFYNSDDKNKSNCNNSLIIVQNQGEKLDRTAEKSCDSFKNNGNGLKIQEVNINKSIDLFI
jgi:hypothetical protein